MQSFIRLLKPTTLFAVSTLALSLLAGCSSSSSPDATVDSAVMQDASMDVDVMDVAADGPRADSPDVANMPLFLVTIRGTLRAAGSSDGGVLDASDSGANDSGAGDSGASDSGAGDAGPPAFDLSYARGVHNGLVMRTMAMAMMSGELTHHASVGTANASQALFFDTWNSLAGINALLGDAQFQAGFNALFESPPTPAIWLQGTGFTQYVLPATGNTRVYVSIRGTLRAGAMGLHNQVLGAAMGQAVMAGNVSHTVWLGLRDTNEFQGIQVWTNPEGVSRFLSNPLVSAALGMLFTSPPVITTFTPPADFTTTGTMPAWGTP